MSSNRSASTSPTARRARCSETSCAPMCCAPCRTTRRGASWPAPRRSAARGSPTPWPSRSCCATRACRRPRSRSRPPRSSGEFRQRSGLRQDSVLISTLGRLEEEKGLDTLVAMAELAATAPARARVRHRRDRLARRPARRAGADGPEPDRAAQHQLPRRPVPARAPRRSASSRRASSPASSRRSASRPLSTRRSASRCSPRAIGGVPEATPDDRFLVAPGTPAAEWLAQDRRGAREPGRAQRGRGRLRRQVHQRPQRPAPHRPGDLAADRLNRQAPLKADPVDDYLATWPARSTEHGREPEAARPARAKPRTGALRRGRLAGSPGLSARRR